VTKETQRSHARGRTALPSKEKKEKQPFTNQHGLESAEKETQSGGKEKHFQGDLGRTEGRSTWRKISDGNILIRKGQRKTTTAGPDRSSQGRAEKKRNGNGEPKPFT